MAIRRRLLSCRRKRKHKGEKSMSVLLSAAPVLRRVLWPRVPSCTPTLSPFYYIGKVPGGTRHALLGNSCSHLEERNRMGRCWNRAMCERHTLPRRRVPSAFKMWISRSSDDPTDRPTVWPMHPSSEQKIKEHKFQPP